MDVLASGPERTAREAVAGLRGWRPRGWLVAALALAVLAAGVGAAALLPSVRDRLERVELEVQGHSVAAVRARSRDGVLVLDVRNAGGRPVALRRVELLGEGVSGTATPAVHLEPGRTSAVDVPFTVPSCALLGPSAQLRLHAASGRGRVQVVELAVGDGGALPFDVVAAGCRPALSGRAVALAVRSVGGQRRATSAGVQGIVLLEVRNDGAPVQLLRLSAEVPGVLFSPAGTSGLPGGGRVVLRLGFQVPSCAALRRTGRVVLTVLGERGGPREIGFRVTEDEEARTVRDVDLDLVLTSCRDGRPAA